MANNFKAMFLALAVAVTCLTSKTAISITVTDPFHYLDNIGDNSVGLPTGIRQQFGAVSVVPNGDNGTSGMACQNGVCLPLIPFPHDTAPNFFGRSIPFTQNLTGSWALTFTNESDASQAATPTIAGAQVAPFVNSVTLSGNGAALSFNWTIPNTFVPDAVVIRIRDTTDFIGAGGGVGGSGVANVIYANIFSGTTTHFTVNPSAPQLTQPLQQGRTYSLEIGLVDTRDNQARGNIANFLSDSLAFFDFSLLPAGTLPTVVLPTLVLGATPYYRFNTSILGGQPVFIALPAVIGPLAAIGYDFQIGPGDPNFASVLLPTGIGDNLFDLWLWDGLQFIDSGIDLIGGVEYFFGGTGVDRFRILGIETLANLASNHVTAFEPLAKLTPDEASAFIGGLTFTADGQFTGILTPLLATTFSLTVNSQASPGSGTVTSSPPGIDCGSDCAESYARGTVVTLTAAPAGGSVFAGWGGACGGENPTCQVTMDQARSVTATFTNRVTFRLKVTQRGNGKGVVSSHPAGVNCGGDCTQRYASGVKVKLTARAKSGSTFAGWSGACRGSASTCTVTMSLSKTVTAAFVKKGYYLLTVSKAGSGGGSVTSTPSGITCGSDCSQSYRQGMKVKLTAKASRGSIFVGWKGSCSGRSATCQVALTKTRAITATFNRRSAEAADEALEWLNSSERGVDELGFDLFPGNNRP